MTELRSVIEDHALHPVPADQRRSGWNLLANTAGVGTTLVVLGVGSSVTYLAKPAHAAQAASLGGTSVPAKIAFMAAANPGAYFIVLAGFLGFAVMYAAQAKAQVLNTYSGSLALS